jgi:hypothetical protein
MELQKGPTMTRTQEWNCLSAQQLVHQLLVCDIERARRFVQANANDWLAERGGFCPNPARTLTLSQPMWENPYNMALDLAAVRAKSRTQVLKRSMRA